MAVPDERLELLSLEITGRCQLRCRHCYAMSGPEAGRGSMSTEAWLALIEEAAGIGAARLQFIGGEPTLHPDLATFVMSARAVGIRTEVYTNLVSPRASDWAVFGLQGVELATSYYSRHATVHDGITGLRGSHARTLANIEEAVRRGIALRVGVIAFDGEETAAHAVAELQELGIEQIVTDRVRAIGRAGTPDAKDAAQLCGRCGSGKLAVLPNGRVTPCPLARWVDLGNVKVRSLAAIFEASILARRALARPADADNDGGCSAPLCAPHIGK